MKDNEERNYFSLKTCFENASFPCQNAFEKCTTKTNLSNGKSYTKKLYTKLQPQMPWHVSAYLRIVTPPRFREKRFYVKLTTFSAAQETKNEIKPIADPKSASKINARSRWTLFPNFTYVSSYLHLKDFTWKRD